MRARMGLCCLACAATFWCAGAVRAETGAEVEGKVLEAWAGVTSITAALVLETTVLDLPMLGAGDAAVLKADGKEFYRQSIQLDFPPPMGVQGSIRSVYDGESLFVVNELMGRAEAFKSRPGLNEAPPPPSPVLLLNAVKAAFDLEAAEYGEVDGRAAWWLEGPRREQVERVERIRLAFDRETGFPLQITMHTPGTPEPVVISYTGLAVDAELDPADFVFAPPEGVELDAGREVESAAPPETPAAPDEDAAVEDVEEDAEEDAGDDGGDSPSVE